MSKVNSFLSQRFKVASEKISKMTGLAELSSSGHLSSFSGVFRVGTLSEKELAEIEMILTDYHNEGSDLTLDLRMLSSITSEVKAINSQAAILHGERIKKAQEILKKYRDGAFTAWLLTTYGNRQTPYNFLQYYELYISLPETLHGKLDDMPKQAVYTLASRAGSLEKKEEIIKNYQGEPKQQLLTLIRDTFPLEDEDKRAEDRASQALTMLLKIHALTGQKNFKPSPEQKKKLQELLLTIHSKLGQ
jgi:uncharacterized protein (DUF433 family)